MKLTTPKKHNWLLHADITNVLNTGGYILLLLFDTTSICLVSGYAHITNVLNTGGYILLLLFDTTSICFVNGCFQFVLV